MNNATNVISKMDQMWRELESAFLNKVIRLTAKLTREMNDNEQIGKETD